MPRHHEARRRDRRRLSGTKTNIASVEGCAARPLSSVFRRPPPRLLTLTRYNEIPGEFPFRRRKFIRGAVGHHDHKRQPPSLIESVKILSSGYLWDSAHNKPKCHL